MRFEEFFPIAGGFVLGCLTRYLYRRTGRTTISLAAILLGLAATVSSGEFRQSWGFLFIDVTLVALSTLAGYLTLALLYRPGKLGKV